MMKKLFSTTCIPISAGQKQNPFLRRFARGDDGAITIFACAVILMFLVVGGIGVDLMRNEMQRVKIQHTADRAVLAAADMEQTLDAESVVLDYFDKSGLGHLVGPEDVTVNPGLNFRNVSVKANSSTPARFMPLLGIEELPVRTFAAAEERVPNIEISLVLDISGSMRFNQRMDKLRPAAKEFVNTVLAGGSGPKTTVTLVPYAGQTNPGPFMFERLGGVRYAVQALDEADGGIPESESHGYLPAGAVGGSGSLQGVRYVYPNVSSCLDINPTGFSTSTLPAGALYDQTPHFMNWTIASNVMDWGWCPQDQTAIKYMSNDGEALGDLIDTMRMHDGTGTHYAMKWAVAMLDPSSRDDVDALINANLASSAAAGRPADFDDNQTTKYIVLMTDGQITEQFRPRQTMHGENPTEELQNRPGGHRTTITSARTNVQSFTEQCNLAKSASPRPIIVYTIAFDAPNSAQNEMRACASSPSHFFKADTSNISNTFRAIARQINQLRLTQ